MFMDNIPQGALSKRQDALLIKAEKCLIYNKNQIFLCFDAFPSIIWYANTNTIF